MKANRKFVESREAVSAVIGVILMVAITVAIAAVVYVWVTSFGGGGTPAPSMSIDQVAAVTNDHNVSFSVLSASPNAKWTDLKIQVINGSKSMIYTIDKNGHINNSDNKMKGNVTGSGGEFSNTVGGGDIFYIQDKEYIDAGAILKIIHIPSNSVIVTKTLY